MTDTLADSRTTSRVFTEGVPVVVEEVGRRPATERQQLLDDPGFGRYFTDTMFVARYRVGEGWYDARLTAYAPLQVDPATAALHYAQSIFEGLKAYAQPDGSVATFRPEANAARFARGARRLAMPPVPEDAFLAAVDALVDADRDWVPTDRKSTRLNSSHANISYAVFCLKKKKYKTLITPNIFKRQNPYNSTQRMSRTHFNKYFCTSNFQPLNNSLMTILHSSTSALHLRP